VRGEGRLEVHLFQRLLGGQGRRQGRLARPVQDPEGHEGRRQEKSREEKEGGSSGLAVIEARSKALAGFDYEGIPITGSKDIRFRPFCSYAENGNVRLVRGRWNNTYVDELVNYPGEPDDQVDGTSAAYNSLVKVMGTREPGDYGVS